MSPSAVWLESRLHAWFSAELIILFVYFTNRPLLTSSRTFTVYHTLFCLGITIPAHVLACNLFANGNSEKVVSPASAWSPSLDLLNYALSTNNPELIALLSQARDLIQFDYRKAIESRRQVSITDFFANQ